MRKLVFFWDNFGPLHIDRCEAVATRFAGKREVIGLELASKSKHYSWVQESSSQFLKITLINGKAIENIPWVTRFRKILKACLSLGRDTHFFMCHYNDTAVFAASATMRLFGLRVYTMGCSKFDDYDRYLFREVLKSILYLPYQGAIGSGVRSRDYMRFLGINKARVKTPYNAVSLKRIRNIAGASPAPDGMPFEQREFALVARLIPKKNIPMALKAMALYAQQTSKPRPLNIYGDGRLEAQLRDQASAEGIAALVRFHGFVQTADVSKALAHSLALLLPSIEEQFGNVVPEALAMGIPVILSDKCGARDVLVRSGVNGFLIENDNPAGMAYFMKLLSEDEGLWRRMCLASQQMAEQADSERFAEAVESLISE